MTETADFINRMIDVHDATNPHEDFAPCGATAVGLRAVFAADPLRQALGEAAIKAILEGKAAVVPYGPNGGPKPDGSCWLQMNEPGGYAGCRTALNDKSRR